VPQRLQSFRDPRDRRQFTLLCETCAFLLLWPTLKRSADRVRGQDIYARRYTPQLRRELAEIRALSFPVDPLHQHLR